MKLYFVVAFFFISLFTNGQCWTNILNKSEQEIRATRKPVFKDTLFYNEGLCDTLKVLHGYNGEDVEFYFFNKGDKCVSFTWLTKYSDAEFEVLKRAFNCMYSVKDAGESWYVSPVYFTCYRVLMKTYKVDKEVRAFCFFMQ